MQKGLTPKGQIITGYKMTDDDMKCRGYQFELGKWYEHDGDIELCTSGFHFCEYPSGPWAYYSKGRMFKIEAEFVKFDKSPGADLKHVAKRIKLTEEIAGHGNAGDRNTGHWNAGDGNTGHWNAGDGNTGDGNTGHWNAGDRNTGHGNCCNRSSGFFNTAEQFFIFDKLSPVKRSELPHYEINRLSLLLGQNKPFDYSEFTNIPNATVEKIKQLHEKHIQKRKELETNEV